MAITRKYWMSLCWGVAPLALAAVPAPVLAQDAPEAARPQASPRSGPAGSPAQAAPPMVQKPEKPVRPDLGLAGADMK